MTIVKPGARFACVQTVHHLLSRELTLPRATEQAEKELLTVLALKGPTCPEIDVLVKKYSMHNDHALSLRNLDIAYIRRRSSSKTSQQQRLTRQNLDCGTSTAKSTPNSAHASESFKMEQRERSLWNGGSSRSATWNSSNPV